MGCPDREAGHRIAWLVRDVDGQRVSAIEAMLRQTYTEVRTAELDLAKRRWVGTGRILDDDLKSPALHAYVDVEDRFEPPWVHVTPQAVSLRLLPHSDMELFVDLRRLKNALHRRNVLAEPRIRHHSLSYYDHLRKTLREHILGDACRDLVPA